MIKIEIINIDGRQLTRTYSDTGFYIYGGFPEANYTEAIDPIDSNRTYIETDIPIENKETGEEQWQLVN